MMYWVQEYHILLCLFWYEMNIFYTMFFSLVTSKPGIGLFRDEGLGFEGLGFEELGFRVWGLRFSV